MKAKSLSSDFIRSNENYNITEKNKNFQLFEGGKKIRIK